MRFDGTVIIIDPCSTVCSNEDWHKCGFGENMTVLGFSQFLYIDAGSYGNGSIIDNDNRIIGTGSVNFRTE